MVTTGTHANDVNPPGRGDVLISSSLDASSTDFPTGQAGSPTPPDRGSVLAPLGDLFDQVRSRDRVRDLAEVFTHQREVDAMLDLIPGAFTSLDVKFMEPSSGSGNFLVETLRRKLRLVTRSACPSQDEYEHRLLRAVASIYGVDISADNVTEARGRMAHVLLGHHQCDADTAEPTAGFLNAAVLILEANVVCGDVLSAADRIELCDWQPHPEGCFQRIWSHALVPPQERNLFWMERVQDREPCHFSALSDEQTR
jgi:hypothetical protein